ncbi:Protein nedd1 [Mortierella alpina]|nr:Protein nedd1 [Mortierella alpina]
MDPPESRPITQRKRSYSTTAYSSQEEEAAFANNKPDHAQAPLPTCLLAATAGNQLMCYEFINNGTVPSTPGPKHSQLPIAVPGQYDGIKMSGVKLSHGVSSLKWSPDNTMLAIEGHDGRVSLHDSRGRLQESLVTDPVLEDSKAGNYRCAMSWAPKPQRLYLAHGRKVMTWDAVQRRSIEAFETGSRINALAINADDTLLAIGQNNGSLEVVNRTSGSGAKLDTPVSLVMSRIEYSVFNRSVLGGVGNDGILRLWDTGSNGATAVYHSFATTHELPISAMAFSPFNRYLICTAGLDKRYALYDVEKKNIVKNAVTEYALTSVSFKNDGISMAFGTDQGKVLLYDLRSTSRPICVVDTQTDAPITAIQFQGKVSSSLKRHQTINGYALKRQNSAGTKTSVFSTKDSPFNTMGLTQVNNHPSKEAAPKTTPAKGLTLSQSSLNLLSGSHRESGQREVQSAGANGRGLLDFFSSKRGATTMQPTEGTSAALQAGTERTQTKVRRPTAPASIFTSGATLTSAPASASRSSLPATPSAPGPEYGSIPHTPAKKPNQESGSYPNSRTVSPFAFQTIQSRSPSDGSSISSSSVNTPPGSPPANAAASTTPKHSHLEHHHYQYASVDSLSKSPSRASRAKRRKSFGALLASGGASSAPGTPDAMSDEKMELLSGQIVDRVRNVLLDQDRPLGSSERPPSWPSPLPGTTAATSNYSSRDMQARPRQSTVPELSAESSKPDIRPATKPAMAVKDLWMRLGAESEGSHAPPSSSRPKSPPLAQSVLPSTSITPSNKSSIPSGTSSSALLPSSSSFPTQILESVIEGCLADFRVGIRSDIQNMHLELLRQFQIQKMGIEQLLKQYTDTKELQEENERLREENQRLRMNY